MANAKKVRPFRIKWDLDPATMTLRVTARNDEDAIIANHSRHIDPAKFSAANREYAMLFGVKQTVADTSALSTGATLEARWAEMMERADHLESGSESWTTRHAGEGTILFRALMLQKPGRDADALRAKLDAMDEKTKKGLMNSPELREFVNKVRGVEETSIADALEELDAI